MNLEKLSPAPWQNDGRVGCCGIYSGERRECFDDVPRFIAYCGQPHDEQSQVDWDFVVLARAVFEVMTRHGVTAMRCPQGGWEAVDAETGVPIAESLPNGGYADPFTAIAEGYRDHVEKEPS